MAEDPIGELVSFHAEGLSSLEIRSRILDLESRMQGLEQLDLPLKHHFAEGSYGREIFVPKGSLVIGKIHKHSHVNVVSQGECSVLTEFGVDRIKAPFTFVSKPGTKRVVYTHEDTIWTTIHVTDETDLEKVEDVVIAKTYEEFEAMGAKATPELGEGAK